MNDMFGNEITEEKERALLKKRKRGRDPKPNGYAAVPGTGPAGENCKTCKHIVRRRFARTYMKCGLMTRLWTGSIATDIRAKSPACRNWERPDEH